MSAEEMHCAEEDLLPRSARLSGARHTHPRSRLLDDVIYLSPLINPTAGHVKLGP